MPEPSTRAASSPVTPPQSRTDLPLGPTVRERCHRHRIYRLRSLPPWMFREAFEQLDRGGPPATVARWILSHPERGGMQDVTSFDITCKYVYALADEIKQQRAKAGPPAAARDTQVVQEEVETEN